MKKGSFFVVLFLFMVGCTADFDHRRKPDEAPTEPTDYIINIDKLLGSQSGLNVENQDTNTDGLLNSQIDFGIITNPGNGTIPRVSKNFVLRNASATNKTINVSAVNISETSPKGFFVRYDRCSGKTLGPNQECLVSVSFLARGIYNGPKVATFELVTPQETFSFNLLATIDGYPPPVQTGTPSLSIITSANFGDYPTNEEVFRTITIQNSSPDVALQANTLTVLLDDTSGNNGFYIRYNSCLTTVLPNTNCKISIFFQKHRLVRFAGESLLNYQASLIIPFMNQTVDLLTGSVSGGTGSFKYPTALNKAGSLSFSDVNNSISVNDQIYFSAKESTTSPFKLYKLDNGVGKLVDSSIDEPLTLKKFSGKLYFTTFNKLYAYDGATLTEPLAALGLSIVSDPRIQIEYGGKLYISANFSDRYRLIKYDEVNGYSEVLESGNIPIYEAGNFEEKNTELYFKARSGGPFAPFKLYLSNGNTYGQVCQISSLFTNVTPFAGNKFLFYETSYDLINYDKTYRKMYVCDNGGVASEVKLGGLSLNLIKSPTVVGNDLFFSGHTNSGGEAALYRYNVSSNALTEITSSGSSFRFTSNIHYKSSRGEIYFVAAVVGPDFNPRLYRYDTSLGTLVMINSNYSNTSGHALELIGDNLYFEENENTSSNVRRLVKYDVSAQTMSPITNVGNIFGELLASNGELYFTVQNGGASRGLFKLNTSGSIVNFGVTLSANFFPFDFTNDGTFIAVGSNTMYKVLTSSLQEFRYPDTNTFLNFNSSNEKLYKKIISSNQGLFLYGQRYTNDLKKPYLSTGNTVAATEIVPDYIPYFLSIDLVTGSYDELFVVSNGNLFKQDGNNLYPVLENSNALTVPANFKIYSTAPGLPSYFVDNSYRLYQIPYGAGNNAATVINNEVSDITEYGGSIYYYGKYTDTSPTPMVTNCYTPHLIDATGNVTNFYDSGSYCFNSGNASSFISGKFYKTASLGLLLREQGSDTSSDCSGQLSLISGTSLSGVLPYNNPLRMSNLVEKNGEIYVAYTNGADYIYNLNTGVNYYHANSMGNAFGSGMCAYGNDVTIDDTTLSFKNIGNNTAGSGYAYFNLAGKIFMASSSTNSFSLVRDPDDTMSSPPGYLTPSYSNYDLSHQMTFSSPSSLLMSGNSMYASPQGMGYLVSGDANNILVSKILDIPGISNVQVRYSGYDNQEILGVGPTFFVNYSSGPNGLDALRYDPSNNTSSLITDPSSGLELYDLRMINHSNGTTFFSALERGGTGFYKIYASGDGYSIGDYGIVFDSMRKIENTEVVLVKGRYNSDPVSKVRTFVFYSATYVELVFQSQGIDLQLPSLIDTKNGYDWYMMNADGTRLFRVDASSYALTEILIPTGYQASLVSAGRSMDGKLILVLPKTSGGLQVFRLDP